MFGYGGASAQEKWGDGARGEVGRGEGLLTVPACMRREWLRRQW